MRSSVGVVTKSVIVVDERKRRKAAMVANKCQLATISDALVVFGKRDRERTPDMRPFKAVIALDSLTRLGYALCADDTWMSDVPRFFPI